MKNLRNPAYPACITSLPEAEIPFAGVRGWLLQGAQHQIVFFDIDPIGEVPPHSHGTQWGVVLEGEMELTIADVSKLCRRGDTYYIPAGVVHSAVFKSHFRAVDFFADADRYSIKK